MCEGWGLGRTFSRPVWKAPLVWVPRVNKSERGCGPEPRPSQVFSLGFFGAIQFKAALHSQESP